MGADVVFVTDAKVAVVCFGRDKTGHAVCLCGGNGEAGALDGVGHAEDTVLRPWGAAVELVHDVVAEFFVTVAGGFDLPVQTAAHAQAAVAIGGEGNAHHGGVALGQRDETLKMQANLRAVAGSIDVLSR